MTKRSRTTKKSRVRRQINKTMEKSKRMTSNPTTGPMAEMVWSN